MTINEVLNLENQQEKIGALLLHGYRFVTMTVVDKGEEFDILCVSPALSKGRRCIRYRYRCRT